MKNPDWEKWHDRPKETKVAEEQKSIVSDPASPNEIALEEAILSVEAAVLELRSLLTPTETPTDGEKLAKAIGNRSK